MKPFNQEYILSVRNKNRQIIRYSNRVSSHDGCTRTSSNETPRHRLAKFLLMEALKKEGKEIYSEAIFEDSGIIIGRGDIVVVDDRMIFEVLETESKEECSKKTNKYPEGWKVYIKTAKEIIDKYLPNYVNDHDGK